MRCVWFDKFIDEGQLRRLSFLGHLSLTHAVWVWEGARKFASGKQGTHFESWNKETWNAAQSDALLEERPRDHPLHGPSERRGWAFICSKQERTGKWGEKGRIKFFPSLLFSLARKDNYSKTTPVDTAWQIKGERKRKAAKRQKQRNKSAKALLLTQFRGGGAFCSWQVQSSSCGQNEIHLHRTHKHTGQ